MNFRSIETHGCIDDIARVYIAELEDGSLIEFADALQPPLMREQKWVLIVSTLKGCPYNCPICDAGGSYRGKLSFDEILGQIDFMIRQNFPNGTIPIEKFKIQFARMGDPGLNGSVLQVLEQLPFLYKAPGLIPCISTIVPSGKDDFFERLLEIKNELYSDGRFQMQFSLHTSSEEARSKLISAHTWSFTQIAEYGTRFKKPNDKKITLNFAAVQGMPLEPESLLNYFSPAVFIIKLTPVNPTFNAQQNNLIGLIDPMNDEKNAAVVQKFQDCGYDTILSIGELSENQIGSNCGMMVKKKKMEYSKLQISGSIKAV
jgi:23S rRNA (adenine2503-C2)-methyltransferase